MMIPMIGKKHIVYLQLSSFQDEDGTGMMLYVPIAVSKDLI